MKLQCRETIVKCGIVKSPVNYDVYCFIKQNVNEKWVNIEASIENFICIKIKTS